MKDTTTATRKKDFMIISFSKNFVSDEQTELHFVLDAVWTQLLLTSQMTTPPSWTIISYTPQGSNIHIYLYYLL